LGVGEGIAGFSLSLPRSVTSILLLALFHADGFCLVWKAMQLNSGVNILQNGGAVKSGGNPV